MPDDEWEAMLEDLFKATRDFSRIEIKRLAGKVIRHLQQLKATGVFGDDYGYKALWDEYCHEVRNGPHALLEWTWDQTIDSIINEFVNRVPNHVALLISVYAQWEIEIDRVSAIRIDHSAIGHVVKKILREEAGNREIGHLSIWRKA